MQMLRLSDHDDHDYTFLKNFFNHKPYNKKKKYVFFGHFY